MSEYLEIVARESISKYMNLKEQVNKLFADRLEYKDICIYACGSMGRFDMTKNSDLDLFFIDNSKKEEKLTDLNKHVFFADLYKLNEKMNYQEPSKGGEYWRFTDKVELLDIGSRDEDYNNSFTARLLLMLESKPLLNDTLYDELLKDTVDKYFVDYEDNQGEFVPLFLMNDILRYWYTLTLNYEFRRDSNDSNYKKYWKRLKLKYARLITCFSMYICLFDKDVDKDYVIDLIKKTPLERLADIALKYPEASDVVERIFEEYEWYLQLRDRDETWWAEDNNKKNAFDKADLFHDLVTHELLKIVAITNAKLSKKTELITRV